MPIYLFSSEVKDGAVSTGTLGSGLGSHSNWLSGFDSPLIKSSKDSKKKEKEMRPSAAEESGRREDRQAEDCGRDGLPLLLLRDEGRGGGALQGSVTQTAGSACTSTHPEHCRAPPPPHLHIARHAHHPHEHAQTKKKPVTPLALYC